MTTLAEQGALAVANLGLQHASTQAVIVATPLAMDPIRLVGDEEKHATVLYFGETSSLPVAAKPVLLETLQQVSLMVEPFGERITEISRLGEDDPPALVAKLTGNYLSNIREILQVNPDVKGYLSNAQQHDGYTPHVTLAYPDYKGEADLRQKMITLRRIGFDHLSLWWNSERHEFPLNYRFGEDVPESAGWSEDLVNKYLEHHGVKGMRWGVRRTKTELEAPSEEAASTAATRARTSEAKGSTHALTNQELKDAITRMNLERQYSQLTAAPKSKGKVFAEKMMKDPKVRKKAIAGATTAATTGYAAYALGKELETRRIL